MALIDIIDIFVTGAEKKYKRDHGLYQIFRKLGIKATIATLKAKISTFSLTSDESHFCLPAMPCTYSV
jgi:hypothetical protein